MQKLLHDPAKLKSPNSKFYMTKQVISYFLFFNAIGKYFLEIMKFLLFLFKLYDIFIFLFLNIYTVC